MENNDNIGDIDLDALLADQDNVIIVNDNKVTENLAENVNEATNGDDPADDYVKRFERIGTMIEDLSKILASFDRQEHDQGRLYAAMDHARKSQSTITEMYHLMIEMNNFFGAEK